MATSPRASKAASVSSVGTNASGSLSFLPRYTPKPEPVYISAPAAADHVTHHHSHDQFDLLSPTTSPTNDGAIFSDAALSLLNTFLDSLLYNFLAKARGTTLSQLRPAITEVLKAKLARDALSSADEELGGFEGDDMDSDDENTETNGQWSQDWHLEMAFKRMRLRVMVFIRLGDFDDEDEDRFLEEEDEFRNNGEKPAQDMNFLVNSPAAVYLASILEHVAEQALSTAGESAYRRSVSRMNRRSSIPNSKELEGMDLERVIVQEMDVEKIALNPTLGRLWRTWRKNYRNAFGVGGAFSPPASPTPYRGRLGSLNEIAFPPNRFDEDARRALEQERRLTPDEIPEGDVTETDIAANIPLPMSENDVDEIEIMGVAIPLPMSDNDIDEIEIMGVAIPLPMTDNDVNEIEIPGLAKEINDDDEEDQAVTSNSVKRRNSAVFGPSFSQSREVARPPLIRLRSNSTPAPGRLPFFYYFFMPKAEVDGEEEPIPTDESEITQVSDSKELQQSDTKEMVPEPIVAATKEPEVVEEPKPVEEMAMPAPVEDEEAATAGAEAAPIAFDDEKIPVEANTMPVVAEEVKAPVAAREDSGHALGAEDTDHKKEAGIVAGVVAGAAALAGAAYATIAGSSSKTEEIEEQNMAMASAPKAVPREKQPDIADRIKLAHRLSAKNLDQLVQNTPVVPEEPMPVSPAMSTSAPSGPVSAIEEPDKATIVFPKRTSSYVPTGPIPRSNPDDYPGAVPLVAAAAVQHSRTGSGPFAQTKPEYEASVSSQGSGYDLGTVSASALAQGSGSDDVHFKRKSIVPTSIAMATREEEKAQYSSSEDHDVEEIGVARTTNERVQSISSSPRSTTPDQQRSYYLPGSPKAGPSTSRPGSSSRDRSLVGADDYILARQTSASKRNTGPSPLRSVTEADSQPKQNGVSARDTPHAVPFYHNRSVNDEALKQDQLNKRVTKDSAVSEALDASKTKSRPPPLNTAFVPTAEAARPSTAQSAGRRSTSSTPPGGHSAKGSASSSFKRPSDESRRKDFDSLLKEGETVKYTLTPDGLRESDPFRPTSSNLNRASALALSTAAIDRGPPSPRIISSPSSGRRPSAHDIAAAAAAASPKSEVTKVTVISQPTVQPPQKKGYIPRVSEFRKSFSPRSLTSRPEPMNTNTRKSGFLPREPRVMTDDTRDFADFMRSTKPTAEPTLVPLVRSPSDQNLLNKAKAQAAQPPRPFSRQKLVPREPDIKGGGSGDLIDFIREGPPSAHGLGEHRIPRNVAPFRSTADSEDLKDLGSFIQTGTTPIGSMTSKTPRMTGANTASLPQNVRAGPSSSGSGMPPIVRKSRRVKDPYAIDSDDEDDYLTSLPSSRSQQKEESLADFLKNNEPPKANAPAAISMGSRPQTNVKSNMGGPVRTSSIANSMATSRMSRMKFEARPAGATKSGFGGNGFHYSTNDMADFLRSSGPVEAYAVAPEVPLTKKPSKRGFSRGRG